MANVRKTRDRILDKSLELFNEQGERCVTTNHIAAALGISPGNLYYYFRNKEAIIAELFERYAQHTLAMLTVPERTLTYQDKIGYFEAIFRNMWEYRFLHCDLEHLLAESPPLKQGYRDFAHQIMALGKHIYQKLNEAGLVEATAEEVDGMILNIWVLTSSWISFLHTSGLFGEVGREVSPALLKRGVYQMILLEAPYLRGEAREKLPELKAAFLEPTSSGTDTTQRRLA